ncbi:MAG: hypothetical protein KY431_09585 [Actinobacteria bacterium]|nr:hypothetical protein [Actinomycetota bacterium]
MSDDPAAVDDDIRRHLAEALETIEVDVDAHWERFCSDRRAERRRSVASRVAVAAAVILLSLTVGRPLLVTGGGAVVRFLSDVVEGTVDRVGDSVEKRIPGLGDAGGTHGTIDRNNPYWVTVRSVHDQLNEAVGYDRWEPDALDGAAERLDGADVDPEFEDEVRLAAGLIRTAHADNDREAAVSAHRIIQDIEKALRKR